MAATETLQHLRCPLRAPTFRTLLLLLYGTGLRIGEALTLTIHNVDAEQRLVTVRDTKFFKTRLVPRGPQLTHALTAYVTQRRRLPLPAGEASAFFATRTACAMTPPTANDLRHTAAVQRLIAWYRAGADVQRLLPHLATYLGHVDLASTQRYLSNDPGAADEASQRFEQYPRPEVRHD